MAQFFIHRPVFAWVIAILMMVAGILSITYLPIAQFPDIAPPTVNISAYYPGASAKAVEEAVTIPIEREMNGAPGLMYTSATSSNGYALIVLTFKQGVNADLAAVEVQNRLNLVAPRLPESVRSQGINIEKASESIPLIVSLTSKDPQVTALQLGELASTNVVQALRRIEGVGKVIVWGTEYAMRIWPDPAKLNALNLTAADLAIQIKSYNDKVVIGEIGELGNDQAPINASIVADSALSDVESFGAIPLRVNSDGSVIRLKDVALVELGALYYGFSSRVDGLNATAMAVQLAPSANIVAVVKQVKQVLLELSPLFPPGVEFQIPYESASFVEVSIQKVLITLLEAMVLVFLVMYLFLQNIRATLIPTLVVPIALLATFAVIYALGFSINVLTMFGMVLAIGILVDDAIVVVENVERIMAEEGLPPLAATIKAMEQISGAIIGITAVLVAVFVPMALFSGAVGHIYRQFAVSLAVSIAFSALLALSLTPALCATLLKPLTHKGKNRFFDWFNHLFNRSTMRYTRSVAGILQRPKRMMVIYMMIVAITGYTFSQWPSAFVPQEDQGNFMVMVTEPNNATLSETMLSLAEVSQYLRENEPIEHTFEVGGFSNFGSAANVGMIFIVLQDWQQRQDPQMHVEAIVQRVNARFAGRPDRSVYAMNTPALPELGSATGFDMRLQNRGGLSDAEFTQARDALVNMGAQHPDFYYVIFAGLPDVAQVKIKIDRNKMQAMQVSMSDVTDTLAIMFGSSDIGDFIYNGQVRKVIVQAPGKVRRSADDIGKLYVRNANQQMVALSTFVQVEWQQGPNQLTRYNGYPSFSLTGEASISKSSGEAMAIMEQLAAQLPAGTHVAWSGQSLEERNSVAQVPLLFTLSILAVFLVLAALYESWAIPFSVMLVVPLGIAGALTAIVISQLANDIYFKVGLITTIGLSAKNAILIVELAKDFYRDGMNILAATLEAAKLRLRPIIMTSLAFGIGVIPLVLGSGAQKAVGTAVFGGIISGTLLAIFFVPLFFFLVGRRRSAR